MRRLGPATLLLATALTATGCGGSGSHGVHRIDPGPSVVYSKLHGGVPAVHPPLPTIALHDTSGKRFALPADVAGHLTVLYFGYTHCPDECPTTMADLAAALRKVPASVAADVRVVFVTTDPWRDKAPVLRRWLDRFSPSFVGLTGTPSQIAGAQVTMGLPASRRVPAAKGKPGRYGVDHFAAALVYGRDGRLAEEIPSNIGPGAIAADLPLLDKG